MTEYGHFYIGALTGADEVFVIEQHQVEQLGLESDLLLPYAYRSEEIQAFEEVMPSAWAIYPYEAGDEDEAVLLEENALKRHYPNIYRYLSEHRGALQQRKDSRRLYAAGNEWFCYLRPGRFNYVHPRKLLIKGVATQATVGLLGPNTLFNGANCPGFIREDSSPLDNYYLLAVFNSQLVTVYLVQVCPPKLQGYSRFSANNLNTIPLRRISFTTPATRRKALTKEGITEATEWIERTEGASVTSASFSVFRDSRLGRWLDVRLAAQPEESDVVHDLLAFLAGQMIDLNKRKQAEQKRFLVWLEGVLKINPDRQGNTGLDALTGKSRLRNYLGDYQKDEPELPYEELEDILFRNKTRLGVSLSDTRFTARLRAEYDKSLAVLRPIKAQLARTDALIDQVVYRLYGLSEDEIAVVEGKR